MTRTQMYFLIRLRIFIISFLLLWKMQENSNSFLHCLILPAVWFPFSKMFTYQELHNTLIKQTYLYFEELQTSVPEHSTIFLIKDYISKNYNRETLSVKDISSHVFLSASYVCTFFKNETGRTLNQYLTEYRMEKAKNLLADPRYKIADISSRVGYSDGNYFGKSFKKYTGLSPSEYREKLN